MCCDCKTVFEAETICPKCKKVTSVTIIDGEEAWQLYEMEDADYMVEVDYENNNT